MMDPPPCALSCALLRPPLHCCTTAVVRSTRGSELTSLGPLCIYPLVSRVSLTHARTTLLLLFAQNGRRWQKNHATFNEFCPVFFRGAKRTTDGNGQPGRACGRAQGCRSEQSWTHRGHRLHPLQRVVSEIFFLSLFLPRACLVLPPSLPPSMAAAVCGLSREIQVTCIFLLMALERGDSGGRQRHQARFSKPAAYMQPPTYVHTYTQGRTHKYAYIHSTETTLAVCSLLALHAPPSPKHPTALRA